jgi:hypothetical protein
MCGVSAGEKTIHGIYMFAKIKEKWLKGEAGLELPDGLPSYDTIRCTLGIINPKAFQKLFIKWVEENLKRPEGGYVSIDGKTLRGSGTETEAPLHLLHAYSHEPVIVLGQKGANRKKSMK